jgi:hypothetical protein
MRLRGRQFTDKYENQVIEMKRSFLEFMKAARDRASETETHVGTGADADVILDAEPEPVNVPAATQVKMTADGFPIIPKVVEEKKLSKRDCEYLLRAYLNQHYCKCIT